MVNVFNVKDTGYFNIGMENEYRQEITRQVMWPRVIPWVTWLTSRFQPLSDEVLLVQDENSK